MVNPTEQSFDVNFLQNSRTEGETLQLKKKSSKQNVMGPFVYYVAATFVQYYCNTFWYFILIIADSNEIFATF